LVLLGHPPRPNNFDECLDILTDQRLLVGEGVEEETAATPHYM
jgi:hypothetical protein